LTARNTIRPIDETTGYLCQNLLVEVASTVSAGDASIRRGFGGRLTAAANSLSISTNFRLTAGPAAGLVPSPYARGLDKPMRPMGAVKTDQG
jgi:hypothetical protein